MSHPLGVGVKPEDLDALQVSLRALLIYVFATVALRLADRRFLSRMSAMDIILGIMLGAMLSRVINGSAPIWPTLPGVFVLILLHRLSATLAYHSQFFTKLVKGDPVELYADEQIRYSALRRTRITEDDLLQQIREHGSIGSLDKARKVMLERGGRVSVVKKD